ncbi:MAG: nitronate monooxygenase [Acholeplasmataceae bacterium]|nr:nitronate monooxygenase [Acholeplasmataceae bacterium]
MSKERVPRIIQGGMGVGISSWRLAKTVSMEGELGVISGTAVALTLARRIMERVDEEDVNRALDAFPYQKMIERIRSKYSPSTDEQFNKDRFKAVPIPTIEYSKDLLELTVVACFVEVYMAKYGHDGLVGMNLLEKVQTPTLPSLYGAILAGVDYILMGAGIPIRIPAVLDSLSSNLDTVLPIKIAEDDGTEIVYSKFSPTGFAEGEKLPELKRPKFLAIVSSAPLALHLSRSQYGSPDGFVVEMPIAGGHNAPPRGKLQLSETGEPIYGVRDEVDYEAIQKIGLPFYLAGGYGSHEQYVMATNLGASGIQVGTAFAFCEESGMEKSLKQRIIEAVKKGLGKVRTDPLASPTGFPFKVVEIDETNGIPEIAEKRQRICDLGYLREAYRKDNGNIGYRCPAEPVDDFVKKGGKLEETVGRRCLCNGLVATMGLGQKRRNGTEEIPIVTAGDDLKFVLRFLKPGQVSYTAKDVLRILLGKDLKQVL